MACYAIRQCILETSIWLHRLINVKVDHFTLCVPPPFLPEGRHLVYVSLC
jgi:hypothetical protein